MLIIRGGFLRPVHGWNSWSEPASFVQSYGDDLVPEEAFGPRDDWQEEIHAIWARAKEDYAREHPDSERRTTMSMLLMPITMILDNVIQFALLFRLQSPPNCALLCVSVACRHSTTTFTLLHIWWWLSFFASIFSVESENDFGEEQEQGVTLNLNPTDQV